MNIEYLHIMWLPLHCHSEWRWMAYTMVQKVTGSNIQSTQSVVNYLLQQKDCNAIYLKPFSYVRKKKTYASQQKPNQQFSHHKATIENTHS